MTKLISILVVAGLLFGAWHLFFYWERVKNEQQAELAKDREVNIDPHGLAGLPSELENSLEQARRQGPAVMRQWLKTYGAAVRDPRRAWIELDYCIAITRINPLEARQTFIAIRDRTPRNSPVWPRIQKLEKTYN